MNWLFTDFLFQSLQYFTSSSQQINTDIDIDNGSGLVARLGATQMTNDYQGASNNMEQMAYRASLDWTDAKGLFISANIVASSEMFMDIDAV